jgi:hypothetical protein
MPGRRRTTPAAAHCYVALTLPLLSVAHTTSMRMAPGDGSILAERERLDPFRN